MEAHGLSLVIPVLDERRAAARLGGRLETILAAASGPVQVLLVDDGSTDGSGTLLDAIDLPALEVIHHPRRRGYGASLATGIQRAAHPWIAITDADETYPDQRIPELFARALAQGSDMLVGARTGERVQDPAARQPPKWLIRRLASTFSGTAIPDLNSGLRIMRRRMVERYLHLMPANMSFTSTITLAALAGGWQVDFVPIDYHQRLGRSKFRPVRDTAGTLRLVARSALWFPPLRDLVPAPIRLGWPRPDDRSG